jgi:hypothetical protein
MHGCIRKPVVTRVRQGDHHYGTLLLLNMPWSVCFLAHGTSGFACHLHTHTCVLACTCSWGEGCGWHTCVASPHACLAHMHIWHTCLSGTHDPVCSLEWSRELTPTSQSPRTPSALCQIPHPKIVTPSFAEKYLIPSVGTVVKAGVFLAAAAVAVASWMRRR